MNNRIRAMLMSVMALVMLASSTSPSRADGGSPFLAGQPGNYPNEGLLSYLFHRRPVPTFQAAPWYLYWPYNAHFMTPAPIYGPYMPPPGVGGAMINPYFPAFPGQ